MLGNVLFSLLVLASSYAFAVYESPKALKALGIYLISRACALESARDAYRSARRGESAHLRRQYAIEARGDRDAIPQRY
jgi:hypothetical protein